MTEDAKIDAALRLRAEHPHWGYLRIGKEVGLDRHCASSIRLGDARAGLIHSRTFTGGRVPCPAPGTQRESVISAPHPGPHSAKPDAVYEMIEAYFPTLPKIELNARRARPGWARWGFDAPPEDRQEESGAGEPAPVPN